MVDRRLDGVGLAAGIFRRRDSGWRVLLQFLFLFHGQVLFHLGRNEVLGDCPDLLVRQVAHFQTGLGRRRKGCRIRGILQIGFHLHHIRQLHAGAGKTQQDRQQNGRHHAEIAALIGKETALQFVRCGGGHSGAHRLEYSIERRKPANDVESANVIGSILRSVQFGAVFKVFSRIVSRDGRNNTHRIITGRG
ncbi:hypothetical protein D3C80_290370 [compost metagenome]